MLRRRRSEEHHQEAERREIFHVLRTQALALEPGTLGISATTGLPHVFGVVMDTTYPEGSAALVALADGTASLYTSSGGGVIGGGAHPEVAHAARALLTVAEGHLACFTRRDLVALPAVERVLITVLTYTGRLAVEAREEDLGLGLHPATPVFHAAHEVIGTLRLTAEGSAEEPPTAQASRGGATPLMAAAHSGDLTAAAELVDQGADLEAKDDDGYTALMYAANAGQHDLVRTLIERGANQNARDRQMSSPLMFAAQHDHVTIVRLLLAAGADPTARGDHGHTVLGLAQQNGHRRTVAVLISAE